MRSSRQAGRTIFSGGAVFSPEGVMPCATVVAENGKISLVSSGEVPDPRDGSAFLDLRGKKLVPGFIDIHTHGMLGLDTNEAGPESFSKFSAGMASHGVTSFLPTTLACSAETLKAIVKNARSADSCAGANILGLHLESNFISLKFKGAQPAESIVTPADGKGAELLEIIEGASDIVRIVTVAPEIPGGVELVRRLSGKGFIVSLGHSAATYEEAKAGFKAGAAHATHLFNAMPPLHHRNPGLVGAALEDGNVFAEIICDGLHVHPAVVKTVIKAKGFGRVVPVSDALKGTCMEGGHFEFGGRRVNVSGGSARLEDGTIAGSVTTMDAMCRFLVRGLGFAEADVFRMLSTTPAESLGLKNKGAIRVGADADFAVLDENLEVRRTVVGGVTVHSRG